MRTGGLYGPDVSFLSIEKCDLEIAGTFVNKDAVVIGAPYDGGTSYRSGTRFGPQAIRRLRSTQCSLAVRLINILWVVLN